LYQEGDTGGVGAFAPPFSADGAAGAFRKRTAAELVSASGTKTVLVTGLALDWCVLDTAVNTKALHPDLNVFVVIDAARPSFLPKAAATPYLKVDTAGQCWGGAGKGGKGAGCWLHDPADIAALLKVAGVGVVTSGQIQ
jgi:hypothetical protein